MNGILNIPIQEILTALSRRSDLDLYILAAWIRITMDYGSSMMRNASINKCCKSWRCGYEKANLIIKRGVRKGLFTYDDRMRSHSQNRIVDKNGFIIKDLVAKSLSKDTSTLVKFGVYDTRNAAGKYIYIIPKDSDKQQEVLMQLECATKKQSLKQIVKMLKFAAYAYTSHKATCKYDPLSKRQYNDAETSDSHPDPDSSKGCIEIYAPLDRSEKLTAQYIQQHSNGTSLENSLSNLNSKFISKSSLYRLMKFGRNIGVLSRKKNILCVRDLTDYDPAVEIDEKQIERRQAELTGAFACFKESIENGAIEIAKYNKTCELLDVYACNGERLYNGAETKRMWHGSSESDWKKWYIRLADTITASCYLFGHAPTKRELIKRAEIKRRKLSVRAEFTGSLSLF